MYLLLSDFQQLARKTNLRYLGRLQKTRPCQIPEYVLTSAAVFQPDASSGKGCNLQAIMAVDFDGSWVPLQPFAFGGSDERVWWRDRAGGEAFCMSFADLEIMYDNKSLRAEIAAQHLTAQA